MALNKDNHYCIIMAGGIGSRFWPLSREEKPKQFVDALGIGSTFIQLTYDRFSGFIPPGNFLVLTGENYKELVLEQLPRLSPRQVLTEPCRRNTAPCIAYAMYKLRQMDPEAVAVVTPSDHYISNTGRFAAVMQEGLAFAASRPALLTIGITPTFPATGYGYIQTKQDGVSPVTPVLRFKEKPDLATASQYLAEGDYFWNSGMFIWSAQAIIGAFERYLPDVAALFSSIAGQYGTCKEQEAVNRAFSLSPSISIDYGIMEKAARVYVRCVADLGWSDVGSWGALYSLLEKDAAANAVSGADSQFSHAGQNLIKETNPDKRVIIDGLSGYMVADTEDVLLICPLNDEDRIKEVIRQANKGRG